MCETLFKIIDFKIYAYIRILKYNNAIEIENNTANQLHTIISPGVNHSSTLISLP